MDYKSWIYTKIEDVIFEHHLMDEIYEFYHTEDPTDKIVRGRLGSEAKIYRVQRTSNEEWLFKEINSEQ